MSQAAAKFQKIEPIDMGSTQTCSWKATNSAGTFVLLTYLKKSEDMSQRSERFRERGKRAMSLGENPFISRTLLVAYDEIEKQDFIVTDFIESKPISIATKNLNIEQIAGLYCNVLDALGHIHKANMLHLNLKDSAITIQETSHNKYIAKLNNCGFLLSKGQDVYPIIGTPITMAPELALNHFADERSDLYSLGALMHYSAYNIFPFQRPSTKEGLDKLIRVIQNEVSSPILPPQKINGGNEAFEAIIHRLLDKDSNKRFESATAVKKAIFEAYPSLSNV